MRQFTNTLTTAVVVDTVNEILATKRARFEPATQETPLDDLGLDSLEVAELFAALEENSGFELDPDSGRSLRTVGDLTQLREVSD